MKYTVDDIYESFEFSDDIGEKYRLKYINVSKNLCRCYLWDGRLGNDSYSLSHFVEMLNEGRYRDINAVDYEIF